MWKKTEHLSDEGEEPLKPATEAVGEITVYQYPQIEIGCLSRKLSLEELFSSVEIIKGLKTLDICFKFFQNFVKQRKQVRK